MSNSLVKRSLDMFENDLEQYQDVKKEKKKNKVSSSNHSTSTNKRGMKKELRKLKRLQEKRKKSLPKPQLSTGDTMRRQSGAVDFTSVNLDNISHLQYLGSTMSCSVDKILQHGHTKQESEHPMHHKAVEQKSIFTDKDFEDFEKEYFH